MAASGFNMLTGFEGERPRGIGIAYPDFTGPHLLVSTILAALRERDQTGEGQEIHLTQLTGMISLLGAEWMQYAATGKQPPRRANRDPNYGPHGVYPAKGSEHSEDEWVAIAVGSDGEWVELCRIMDRPDLLADERFTTHADRKLHEDALDELLRPWTATGDKWDIATKLQDAGIAAAAVEHLADSFERDPQLRHHYQTVQQPSRPDIDVPINREAARWVGQDLRLQRSPAVGEHNEEVVCGLLGRSAEEYVALIVDNVLT